MQQDRTGWMNEGRALQWNTMQSPARMRSLFVSWYGTICRMSCWGESSRGRTEGMRWYCLCHTQKKSISGYLLGCIVDVWKPIPEGHTKSIHTSGIWNTYLVWVNKYPSVSPPPTQTVTADQHPCFSTAERYSLTPWGCLCLFRVWQWTGYSCAPDLSHSCC